MTDPVSPNALDNLVEGIEEEAVGEDAGPLVCTVGEGFEHDPPRSFQTEEKAREYFNGRDADPTLVIFATDSPPPDSKNPELGE